MLDLRRVELATVDVAVLRAALGLAFDGATATDASQALVLSIIGGDGVRRGTLVMGLSCHLVFDDRYRDFIGLVAKQISAGLDNLASLEQAKLRAETLAALDRAKTAFFAYVSHEFRTPLTLILGHVDEAVLTLSPLDGEALTAVQRNAQRLLKLVNTLLDFVRIEAGRELASYAPTDLAALTSDLASAFRSAIERAGVQLVAASGIACVLTTTGAVWCWGDNDKGAVSPSVGTGVATPTRVLDGATQIATASDHSCAVLATGDVRCWGDSTRDQLGSSTGPLTSAQVGTDNVEVEVVAEGTCVRKLDGSVWCFGDDTIGELGDGGSSMHTPTQQRVAQVNAATQLAGAFNQLCARQDGGMLWCWGFGFTGDGTDARTSPVVAVPIVGATAVMVGQTAICAELADQTLCFGTDDDGLLGDRGFTTASSPIASLEAAGRDRITLGRSHACAIDGTGELLCWGFDGTGLGERGLLLGSQLQGRRGRRREQLAPAGPDRQHGERERRLCGRRRNAVLLGRWPVQPDGRRAESPHPACRRGRAGDEDRVARLLSRVRRRPRWGPVVLGPGRRGRVWRCDGHLDGAGPDPACEQRRRRLRRGLGDMRRDNRGRDAVCGRRLSAELLVRDDRRPLGHRPGRHLEWHRLRAVSDGQRAVPRSQRQRSAGRRVGGVQPHRGRAARATVSSTECRSTIMGGGRAGVAVDEALHELA